MSFYYTLNTTTTISAYNELSGMVTAMVSSGAWAVKGVTGSTSMIFEMTDSMSGSMPLYVKLDAGSDNTVVVTFAASAKSDMTDLVNNATATPYKITLTDTMTGAIPTISETIINAYNSGFSFYNTKYASGSYGATMVLNIERCHDLGGTLLPDTCVIGYRVLGSTAGADIQKHKLTHTYTSLATASLYTDLFNVVITPTTTGTHTATRPAYLSLGKAVPSTAAAKGWLPSKPYFNQETLSLLTSGPYPYTLDVNKIYGTPYLIACVNGEHDGNATISLEVPYPYLLQKTTDIDLTINGVSRAFYIPSYFYSHGYNSLGKGNQHAYYLFAKE